ncbi:MAG: Undecaprenyl-phosphate N-acetylglucosaminyl 1-phosphate transferase, partial [uncultured Rubrobacteraceae bacterium]
SALPLRHRLHPPPAPAKRGRKEHFPRPPRAHLPAHNPNRRPTPPHQQPLLRRERRRRPRRAPRGRGRGRVAPRLQRSGRALRCARPAAEGGWV